MTANRSGGSGVMQKTGIGGQGGGRAILDSRHGFRPEVCAGREVDGGRAIKGKVSSAVPDNPVTGKLGRRKK